MVTDPVEGAFRWVERSFVGSPVGREECLRSTTFDVDAVLLEDEVTYGDGFLAVSRFHSGLAESDGPPEFNLWWDGAAAPRAVVGIDNPMTEIAVNNETATLC